MDHLNENLKIVSDYILSVKEREGDHCNISLYTTPSVLYFSVTIKMSEHDVWFARFVYRQLRLQYIKNELNDLLLKLVIPPSHTLALKQTPTTFSIKVRPKCFWDKLCLSKLTEFRFMSSREDT